LILAGQRTYPFNNVQGAGPLRLPVKGQWVVGKLSVGNGEDISIGLPLSKWRIKPTAIDAAIWWPERDFQLFHSELHLSLAGPNGTDESVDPGSVFQRVRLKVPSQPKGTWTVTTHGESVIANNGDPKVRQTFYLSIFIHTSPCC
jgi:hypothetical protein